MLLFVIRSVKETLFLSVGICKILKWFSPFWIHQCLWTNNLKKVQIRSMHNLFRYLENISFRWQWAFWNKNIINLAVENEEIGCFCHLKKNYGFFKWGNSFKLSSFTNSLYWPTDIHQQKKHLIWKLSAHRLLLEVYITHIKLHKKLLPVFSKRKKRMA